MTENPVDSYALRQLVNAAKELSDDPSVQTMRGGNEIAGIPSFPVSVELSAPNFMSNKARWALFVGAAIVAVGGLYGVFKISALSFASSGKGLDTFLAKPDGVLEKLSEDSAAVITHLSGSMVPLAWIFAIISIVSMLVAVLAVLGYGTVKINGPVKGSSNNDEGDPKSPEAPTITSIEPDTAKIADKVPFKIKGKGLRNGLEPLLTNGTDTIDGESSEVKDTEMTVTFAKTDKMTAGDWKLVLKDPDIEEDSKQAQKKVTLTS